MSQCILIEGSVMNTDSLFLPTSTSHFFWLVISYTHTKTGVSNSNYLGADWRPVWSLGGVVSDVLLIMTNTIYSL